MKRLGLILILLLVNFSCSDDGINEPTLSLTTSTVSDITETTATSGGAITDVSGKTIIAKGVCWGTIKNPTIADNKTNDISNTGSFTSVISQLMPDETYFIRAYATTNEGTFYGNELSFTTLEKIYNNSVWLTTQQEVDDFGANGYSSILGNLVISGTQQQLSIKDLTPLLTINNVGGLRINVNYALKSLEGLSNIRSVKWDLIVDGNIALENLEGLNNITSIGRDLKISTSKSFKNVEGLLNLTSIGRDLVIYNNEVLQTMDGLNGLISIGRDLKILSNKAMVNLNGINNLSTIGGLIISDNENLNNIEKLINITSVENDLVIVLNPSLTNLEGLNNFTSVGKNLGIDLNNNLINLEGLNKITLVGQDLVIRSNRALTSLTGLSTITSVGEDLLVFNNSSLIDLCDISTLINSGGLTGGYTVSNNVFNPTLQNILDGKCMQ